MIAATLAIERSLRSYGNTSDHKDRPDRPTFWRAIGALEAIIWKPGLKLPIKTCQAKPYQGKFVVHSHEKTNTMKLAKENVSRKNCSCVTGFTNILKNEHERLKWCAHKRIERQIGVVLRNPSIRLTTNQPLKGDSTNFETIKMRKSAF